MMQIHILIADDDPVFRGLLCDIVKKQGYNPVAASNGKEAIDRFFSRTDFSLCILDVMMPVLDGWEVLSEIKQHSDVPVLMLTALGDERYEVKGLNRGADDYIAKPFSYPVLIARIEALLRKTKQEQGEILSAGAVTVNNATHQVTVGETDVILNNKEFRLLCYFIKNKGLVLDRDKIIDRVWGFDFEGDNRTIDAHIKMLRAKLGDCGGYIKTVRGSGYQFGVDYEKEHKV